MKYSPISPQELHRENLLSSSVDLFVYGLGLDIMVMLQKAEESIQRKSFSEVGRNSLAIVCPLTTQIPCGNYAF